MDIIHNNLHIIYNMYSFIHGGVGGAGAGDGPVKLDPRSGSLCNFFLKRRK